MLEPQKGRVGAKIGEEGTKMAQDMSKIAEDGARDSQKWAGSVLGSLGQGRGKILLKFA